jgi:hypothetical protein
MRLDNAQIEAMVEEALGDIGLETDQEAPEKIVHPTTYQQLVDAVIEAHKAKQAELASAYGEIAVKMKNFKCDGEKITVTLVVPDNLSNVIALKSMSGDLNLIGNQRTIENVIHTFGGEENETPATDDTQSELVFDAEGNPVEENDDDDDDDDNEPQENKSKDLFAEVSVGDVVDLIEDMPFGDLTYPVGCSFEVAKFNKKKMTVTIRELEDPVDNFVGDGQPFEVSDEVFNELFTR